MLDKLQQHIDEHNLLDYNDRLLLTVSGGIDSVFMLHLFAQLDYPLALAHCNFALRGVDSDEDENFVRDLAIQYGLPFFNKRFETKKYAKEKGISTQMAARDLRYAWFQELGFDKIAQHHEDDHIETLLLRKSKSSLEGLCGIPVKNGNIVRCVFLLPEMVSLLQNEWSGEKIFQIFHHYKRNEIHLLNYQAWKRENPNIRTELLQKAVNQQKYSTFRGIETTISFCLEKSDEYQNS